MTAKAEKPKVNPKEPAEPATKKIKGESRSVRLDEELQKDVDQVCADEGIALPELVRDALRAHLVNPARQGQQLIRSVAITRAHVERAKAAKILPVETAVELLEKLDEFEAVAQGSNPGRKRKPFRFLPPLLFRTLLDKDDKE